MRRWAGVALGATEQIITQNLFELNLILLKVLKMHVVQALCGASPPAGVRYRCAATIAFMRFQPPALPHPAPLRGCLCVGGGGAVVREIWPYKPVAHSSARR